MKPHDKCSHGKRFDEDCLRCDIAWHEETIRSFTELVERAKKALEKAKAKLKAAGE